MTWSFNFIIILQIITATTLLYSHNPIHSILLLILLFFEFAVTLSFFNLELFSLLLILIYVGAIAVLFLFIVMMLQVKIQSLEQFFFAPIIFVLTFFIIICLLMLLQPEFFFLPQTTLFFSPFEYFSEINAIGQVLYNYYTLCFLIAGLILLLALVGSIILSLNFSLIQTHFVFRTLTRNSNFIIFVD
jgi:NADH-quinone oxidoreductase subunit J